jgi:hypothetical protein
MTMHRPPDADPAPDAPDTMPGICPLAPVLRRRRLWELPPPAQEVVVAMGLTPEGLQSAAEQALARVHGARCRLQGAPADVLYSVLHDLTQRNAMAEAVQRALDARHAVWLQRVARLRKAEPLQALWRQAHAAGEVPGALWALLTHAQGQALQEALLYDARGWVFDQARAAQATGQRAARETTLLEAQREALQALQLRLQALQAERDAGLRLLHAEHAALRGALAQAQDQLRALRHAQAQVQQQPDALAQTPTALVTNRMPACAEPAAPTVPIALAPPAAAAAAAHEPPNPPAPPQLSGRRVLCVGGMPGAQSRYRRIVEAAGGRFEFHDGGLEHSVQRLDQQLGAADVVVCQAGCLNHEAYRRVKGHCRRLDKPCLFVERPSLSHFVGALRAHTAGMAA